MQRLRGGFRRRSSCLDLLVVNRGEAADLLERPEAGLEALEAAADLRSLGPKAVIVTLGADGLAWLRLRARAAGGHGGQGRVEPRGGDAFIGGLAAEWARGASLPEAAAFGQAAAALHVSLAVDQRAGIDAGGDPRAL
jgi:ribokinase